MVAAATRLDDGLTARGKCWVHAARPWGRTQEHPMKIRLLLAIVLGSAGGALVMSGCGGVL